MNTLALRPAKLIYLFDSLVDLDVFRISSTGSQGLRSDHNILSANGVTRSTDLVSVRKCSGGNRDSYSQSSWY